MGVRGLASWLAWATLLSDSVVYDNALKAAVCSMVRRERGRSSSEGMTQPDGLPIG
jgi:hypothetical protein